jgi:hypothetical protein
MMVFHILAKLLCDRRSRPQQPPPVGRLRIELAAPVVAQFPVAELSEVEVIDHDLRVGQQA